MEPGRMAMVIERFEVYLVQRVLEVLAEIFAP